MATRHLVTLFPLSLPLLLALNYRRRHGFVYVTTSSLGRQKPSCSVVYSCPYLTFNCQQTLDILRARRSFVSTTSVVQIDRVAEADHLDHRYTT